MEKCSKCDKEADFEVGGKNVPLCAEHFLEFLRGMSNVIQTFAETLRDATVVVRKKPPEK